MTSLDQTNDFVTVSVAGLILVHVAERMKFDAIDLAANDHGIQPCGHRLITKRVGQAALLWCFYIGFLSLRSEQPEMSIARC